MAQDEAADFVPWPIFKCKDNFRSAQTNAFGEFNRSKPHATPSREIYKCDIKQVRKG